MFLKGTRVWRSRSGLSGPQGGASEGLQEVGVVSRVGRGKGQHISVQLGGEGGGLQASAAWDVCGMWGIEKVTAVPLWLTVHAAV